MDNNFKKREMPKLMACMTKTSLENMRNKALFNLAFLDAKGIRRRKLPLHECLLLELKEAGFTESADYLQDLLYDNVLLVAEDEIGIVVDLRKREDYLEHICEGLQKAEKERDKGDTKKECIELLNLAMYYAEKGKGILWLAEKLYLASIAVASQYLVDGGRQKCCCKFHYAKFLLDKFPDAETVESYHIITEVRDECIGKKWILNEDDGDDQNSITIFCAAAVQLHRILLIEARNICKVNPAKAERLSRLAERRAYDAEDTSKVAEAIIQIGISQLQMNSLKNALNTFQRAFKIHSDSHNIEGICDSRMHLSAALQRLGDHEGAAEMLTEMGSLAMQHGLRRHLGRALHLLGELHLRRERPELGTQHLKEAFACFMGFSWLPMIHSKKKIHVENEYDADVDEGDDDNDEDSSEIPAPLETIYKSAIEIYKQEAEQSRLMMAISAGQENMASYFKVLRDAHACTVAKVQVIDWKLTHVGWWVRKIIHELIPCPCPEHNRTSLDVLRREQELLKAIPEGHLGRSATIDDLQKLRSSFRGISHL